MSFTNCEVFSLWRSTESNFSYFLAHTVLQQLITKQAHFPLVSGWRCIVGWNKMLAEGRRERMGYSQWRELCRTALWRAGDFSAGTSWRLTWFLCSSHSVKGASETATVSLANLSCQILLTGELKSLPSWVIYKNILSLMFSLQIYKWRFFLLLQHLNRFSKSCIWLWNPDATVSTPRAPELHWFALTSYAHAVNGGGVT